MSEHTKGKLIVHPDGGDWSASYDGLGSTAYMGIVSDQGATIALAVASSPDPWNEPEGPDEDARRLVACWNACEGISTEHLEACLSLGERIVEFRRTGVDATHSLLAQRDELLAALKDCTTEEGPDQETLNRARAAIARAEAAR